MAKYDLELYRIKAAICGTLADPKRQMMISELENCEKTVNEIAKALEINQSTTSHHLNILFEGGVVKRRREGSNTYYSLMDSRIVEACNIVHGIILHRAQQYKEFADRISQ